MDAAHRLPDVPPPDYFGTVTWEEYLSLEDPPGFRYEFDEGRLIVSPTGRNRHGRALVVLAGLLMEYERETAGEHCAVLVEHSCFMPPGRRDLRPDVAIVTDARKAALDPEGWIEGAPDIAVEVLSPRTEAIDRGLKAARYCEGGASELWLLDPAAERAEFYRRGEEGWARVARDRSTYATTLLPGFRLDLPSLFEAARRPMKRR